MKTLVSIALVLGCIFSVNAQKNNGLARVQRLDGIEVYLLCEPLRDYQTVTSVTTGVKAESLLTGGLFNESITDKILQFIRRARKQGAVFEAVLYSGGKEIVTINFTENAKPTTKLVAKVRQIEGVDVYALSEPLKDYETIVSSNGSLKWKSALTGGIVNNSIEEDLAGFIKKLRGNGAMTDAVIYSGGKSAMAIKYK